LEKVEIIFLCLESIPLIFQHPSFSLALFPFQISSGRNFFIETFLEYPPHRKAMLTYIPGNTARFMEGVRKG
jgi:hypothetical protein